MRQQQFEFLLNRLRSGNPVTVHLGSISYQQYEALLAKSLERRRLNDIIFSGYFNERQIKIAMNLLISSTYHGNKQYSEQMLPLFHERNFPTIQPYDFAANTEHNVHDVELDGYTLADMSNQFSLAEISRFKSDIDFNVHHASANGDVRTITRAHYLGINFNDLLFQGRLALETACAYREIEAAKTLLKFGASPLRKNARGISALDILVVVASSSILFFMIDQGFYVPCQFMDFRNPIYQPDLDIIRKIVDADNAVLLGKYLRRYTSATFDCALIKSVYAYALHNGKLKVTSSLLDFYMKTIELEHAVIRSIAENDFIAFKDLLDRKIDVNIWLGRPVVEYLARNDCGEWFGYMLNNPLVAPKMILGEFIFTDDRSIDRTFDVVHHALVHDASSVLKAFLIWKASKNKMAINHEIAQIEVACGKYNAVKCKQVMLELDVAIIALQRELLCRAQAGEYDYIIDRLNNGVNLNFICDGTSVTHIMARANAWIKISQLNHLGVDFTSKDESQEYPISIAARLGHIQFVTAMMGHQTCNVYPFKATNIDGYEESLDLIKIAIKHDRKELLNKLLTITSQTNRFGEISQSYLLSMHSFANTCNSLECQSLLVRLINALASGRPLFAAPAGTSAVGAIDLDGFLNNEQNVGYVDRAAYASLNALAAHYKFEIVYNAKKKHYTLISDKYNIDEIFSRLQGIIDSVVEVNYPLHIETIDANGAVTTEIKYMELDVYLEHARRFYTSVIEKKEGYRGNYGKWRSAWTMPNTQVLAYETGLSIKQIWALVILAAEDREPFPGVILSDEEIQTRRNLLVRTMVACRRAYNTNNNLEHDDGKPEANGCLHGDACRPLQAFSKMHVAINMFTSPMPWALEIVERVVKDVLNKQPNREAIINASNFSRLQLSKPDNDMLDQFYANAKPHVEAAIIDEIGVLGNGGSLTDRDLKEALSAIENVELYKNNNPLLAFATDVPDFSPLDHTILGENGARLTPVKLPAGPDAIFIALFLSMQNQAISGVSELSVAGVRNLIADIYQAAFFARDNAHIRRLSATSRRIITIRLQQDIPQDYVFLTPDRARDPDNPENPNSPYHPANIDGVPDPVRYTAEKQEYDAATQKYDEAIHKAILEYDPLVRSNVHPTMLMMQVLSAIWNVCFNVFSLDGRMMSTITPQDITKVSASVNLPKLNICFAANNNAIDFINVYALVDRAPNLAADIRYHVARMDIKTRQQHLYEDEQLYANYEIMHGKNISCEQQNFMQVKIPLDGNSELNAVLAAARNLNIDKANLFANNTELRIALCEELVRQNLAGIIQLDSAYINNIRQDQYPVGLQGIKALANILEINITVYKMGSSRSIVIIDPVRNKSDHIYLCETDGHYNILVLQGEWNGVNLEQAPEIEHGSIKRVRTGSTLALGA